MYKIVSLFKHNIFFAPSGEQTGDYSSNNKFSFTYISKIYLKLNIEEHHGAENLTNQKDPLNFFYMDSIFGEPFQIRIFLHANYKKKAPKISKPFKTDQCVVCLSKKPEVLFLKCGHLFVCLECEEANPFRKCPFCRTQIETKVMI